MLVLSRRIGERVVLAGQIIITITQVERGRVRLGIEAPPSVRILREELQTRPRQEKASPDAVGAGT